MCPIFILTVNPSDKGDKGEKGSKGDSGTMGDQGPMGDRGEMGANGTEGDRGGMGKDSAYSTIHPKLAYAYCHVLIVPQVELGMWGIRE